MRGREVSGPVDMATQAFANISQSTTDGSVVVASTGNRIRVLGVACEAGGTATNITFNSKPAGSGTAISMLFALPANGGFVLPVTGAPMTEIPWFQTNLGEGLTATTGSGSTVGVQVIYDFAYI